MGGGTGGGSSGRAKFAAACLASDFAPFSSKVEPIGESFSTRRQTDGPMKDERMSTMYDGTAPAHIPPSHGRTRESSKGAP